MKKYSKKEILEMKAEGELTQAQALKMIREINVAPKSKKDINLLGVLSVELKRLAESVDASVKNQTQATIDINKILPIMQKTYQALQVKPKIEIVPSEIKHPKRWDVEFERNKNGLIKSPIRLVAKDI